MGTTEIFIVYKSRRATEMFISIKADILKVGIGVNVRVSIKADVCKIGIGARGRLQKKDRR